jgi:hypothetical protein
MAPQLAGLLTERNGEVHSSRMQWANSIFTRGQRQLMRLLAEEIDDEHLTPEVRGAVHVARDAAGRWLRENAAPEGGVDDEAGTPSENV